MVVYKISNIINEKVYIGCTYQSLTRRWRQHINLNTKNKNTILRKAFDKYGRENFSIHIIEVCASELQMFEREVYWINFYNSTQRSVGYNMTIGGDRGPIRFGKDHPNYGKPSTNPNWNEIIYRNLGKKMTEDHKQKFCMSNVGVPKSTEHKNKLSESHIKFYETNKYKQESKDKISAAKRCIISKKRTLILCLNNYKVYDCYQDAAKALGVSAGNIPQVANGKYAHTKGYRFQKVTQEHLIF
jgi:group I intron endonuclease